MLTFAEGTRFSDAKRRREASRHQHLLPARVGGFAAVLEALRAQNAPVVDMTIAYPGPVSFWQFLGGAAPCIELIGEQFEAGDIAPWRSAAVAGRTLAAQGRRAGSPGKPATLTATRAEMSDGTPARPSRRRSSGVGGKPTGAYLEACGHTVDYAADGLVALHLAVTESFDVVVLDVMLPGRRRHDGVRTAAYRRQADDAHHHAHRSGPAARQTGRIRRRRR